MSGGDRAVLRYAVAASSITTNGIDPERKRNAAYAGPYLLVVAGGIVNLSTPSSPSAIAVEELRRLDVSVDASSLAATLERGIEGIRETFRELLAGDPCWEGTATMLTAMLWQDIHVAIAHIGNTRAYMLRGGELTQLTSDHTIGQLLVEEGNIRRDDIGSDPRHGSIIRWLDGEPGEPADIILHEAAVGDRYFLCTNRIDDVMSPWTLHHTLSDTARDPRDVANDVAAAFPAEQYGSLTCVVADVAESQP